MKSQNHHQWWGYITNLNRDASHRVKTEVNNFESEELYIDIYMYVYTNWIRKLHFDESIITSKTYVSIFFSFKPNSVVKTKSPVYQSSQQVIYNFLS